MNAVFSMFKGYQFLGGRGTANTVRVAAQTELATNREMTVLFDFADITGVSHSFTDELIAPLSEVLGEEMPHRVIVCNAVPLVRDTIEAVCDMHRLNRPAFREHCAA